MVLFQKQVTRAKDKCLKKQINFKTIAFLLILIFFSKNLSSKELNSKINIYLEKLVSFSSKFIQSDGNSLEEGNLYIKDDMIRLDYTSPDRTLKINRVKGVYINHELKEEEFFSTKKNIIKTFYDIFLEENFFSSLPSNESNNQIVFEKNIIIDSTNTNLKIYFEIKPLLLRKIITKTENNYISISFYDHNFNEIFEKDFFSFVPIYLD